MGTITTPPAPSRGTSSEPTRRRRRRVWLARSIVALPGALVLVGLAGCGGSDGKAHTTTELVPTTYVDVIGAPSTTATYPVDTTTPGSTPGASTPGGTTTLPPGLAGATVLTANDAVLAAPPKPFSIPLVAGTPCEVLTGKDDAPLCAISESRFGKVVSVTADESKGEATDVRVFLANGEVLNQMLEIPTGLRGQLTGAHVESRDINLNGSPELIVGFRSAGTGSQLELEIVGEAGTVEAVLSLDHGRALLDEDGLQVWSAQFGPNDANCCPRTFLHQRVVFAGGAYRLLTVGTDDVDKISTGFWP